MPKKQAKELEENQESLDLLVRRGENRSFVTDAEVLNFFPNRPSTYFIAARYYILSDSRFVSSILKINLPPYIFAYSELMMSAFACPM